MSYVTCKKCGAKVDRLALFPGGLCLKCYWRTGDRIAKTMTADKLARMWGAPERPESNKWEGSE